CYSSRYRYASGCSVAECAAGCVDRSPFRRPRNSSMTSSTVGGRSMGTAGPGRSIRAARVDAVEAVRLRARRRSGATRAPAQGPCARGRYPRDSGSPRSRASRLTPMDSPRPGVTDFVHIGLVVEDLDETVRFLTLLGFDCGKPGVFSGGWVDRIIGLEDVRVEVVMARGPDGSDVFEVVRFQSPSAGAQEAAPAANRPGLR